MINYPNLKLVIIPKFSQKIKIEIENLYRNSSKLSEIKQLKYYEAENLLLEAVGLQDFKPSSDPVNVKTFKTSFGQTGRLDAEYYLKKYEEVISHISNQNHKSLINIVDIVKSIEPGSDQYTEDDEGLPFYRVADFNKFGLSEPNKRLSESFKKENSELIEKLKPKKGVILFSKDGSVGTAYLLRENLNGITSGAILHLNIKDKNEFLPEYLTLTLNSKLVQMQAERDAGGSIILHWRKEEIENVIVPKIDISIQKLIAELVEESFKLKTESERLLEVAKRAVEIVIEENEETAFEFIKINTYE